MAILKTSWGTKRKAPAKKVEEKKVVPEKKKKVVAPKVEDIIMEAKVTVIEDPTAEEFIATLPKKQRGVKKVNIENQE